LGGETSRHARDVFLFPRDLEDQDDLQKVDQYGRVLAKVFCGDKVLNSELLYNGHANILTQYCSTSEFSGEAWAKRYGC